MVVTPADLVRAPDGGRGFSPYASDAPSLADHGYVQEEWIARGTVEGVPYATVVCVRRPERWADFSGVVIAEPLHVHGVAPVWMYTGEYLLRSGHAWIEIAAQRTTLDMHVKASDPARYERLTIGGPDCAPFDATIRLDDPELNQRFWSSLLQHNGAASTILAQIGAALRPPSGPFAGHEVRSVVLAGHSQTGSVVSYFIEEGHHRDRLADGGVVFDGYFPSGFPYTPFSDVGVPVVQTLSEGDVSWPDFSFRPGFEGRGYRRPDSDAAGDQYRLYELAGVGHMGTRVAPFDDVSLWRATMGAGAADVDFGVRMSTLPHFELFSMTLDHLIRWAVDGLVPPRAERLAIGSDGYVEVDEFGNSRSGVRCVQLDVPHSRYHANPINPDGTPNYFTVGVEVPFDAEQLRRIYGDEQTYRTWFRSRLDDLVAQGWLLRADAQAMLAEAESIDFGDGAGGPWRSDT